MAILGNVFHSRARREADEKALLIGRAYMTLGGLYRANGLTRPTAENTAAREDCVGRLIEKYGAGEFPGPTRDNPIPRAEITDVADRIVDLMKQVAAINPAEGLAFANFVSRRTLWTCAREDAFGAPQTESQRILRNGAMDVWESVATRRFGGARDVLRGGLLSPETSADIKKRAAKLLGLSGKPPRGLRSV